MKNIYQDLLNTLEEQARAVILTTLTDSVEKEIIIASNSSLPAEEALLTGKPFFQSEGEKTLIAEPFSREDRLLVFGGGHVAYILSEIAAKIGFSVIVTEDRPEFGTKERFPWAQKVFCKSFDEVIDSMTISASDHIVLLTRGHFYDKICLRSLYKQERPSYLGILASRRRMGELTSQLSEEGIEKEWMQQIHSPVGLDIGAVTPEEIAIAILAQIIQTKRLSADGRQRIVRSDIDMRVIRHLSSLSDEQKNIKKAIVTVLENNGITPRKAGAKMIVYEDGTLIGTVGGGPAEGNLIARAKEFIQKEETYCILYADIGGCLTYDKTTISSDYLRILIEKG
ncbi:MAG: XdhC/CoxI family protein [Schaedlerella sp.]|nr:XdhC/CoxI family protein [Schaedlerella sp.]